MKQLFIYAWVFVLLLFSGCEEFFEPNYNNNLSGSTVFNYDLNPEYLAGLYVPAYGAIPGSYETFNKDFLDCATDNAVSNDYTSKAYSMYTVPAFYFGGPIQPWSSRYKYIQNVYSFLSVGLKEEIEYRTSSKARSEQVKKRMEGEAYFLLGLNYFQLLRDHAGPVGGVITGVPLVKEVKSVEEAKMLSRNSYQECLDFVCENIDKAIASEGLLPEYSDEYVAANEGLDVKIYGSNLAGLPTTTACYMLKSRALLYGASPAFSKNLEPTAVKELYKQAAIASKKAIDNIGDLPMIYGMENLEDNYYGAERNKELILTRIKQTSDWEKNNYPPSFGLSVKGRTNPSQNLVDAFPMENGYPILSTDSNYDTSNPYSGRDPRFYMTIIYNNATFKETKIEMWQGGNNQVGAPNISDDSRTSRTNYYLRKWMSEKPVFVANASYEKPWHFAAMFRAVEAYLNFAEAANASVGPDVSIDGLTAREALRAVRYRAGVPADGGTDVASDPYLDKLSDITELIKNERRIELCFEGHRYYDVRRWNQDLNTKVRKAEVYTNDGGTTIRYDFTEFAYPNQVELGEHMRYGSIPRREMLVCPNLKQNDGWN